MKVALLVCRRLGGMSLSNERSMGLVGRQRINDALFLSRLNFYNFWLFSETFDNNSNIKTDSENVRYICVYTYNHTLLSLNSQQITIMAIGCLPTSILYPSWVWIHRVQYNEWVNFIGQCSYENHRLNVTCVYKYENTHI